MIAVEDLFIYLANGLLWLGYALLEGAPHWLSVLAAVLLALTFDRRAQARAVYAPSRYGGAPLSPNVPRTAQTVSGITLLLWLVSIWQLPMPIPVIGALMWWAAALALAVMPQQRWSLLWSTKAGLILYSLAVLGYRLYLWQASQLSPSQLAELFGSGTDAAAMVANNRATFATLGAWLLWVVMPVGYLGMLIQNWAAQPMSLVSPLAGAREIIAMLRTRGNDPANRG